MQKHVAVNTKRKFNFYNIDEELSIYIFESYYISQYKILAFKRILIMPYFWNFIGYLGFYVSKLFLNG